MNRLEKTLMFLAFTTGMLIIVMVLIIPGSQPLPALIGGMLFGFGLSRLIATAAAKLT